MRRHLFTLASAVSLLLCAATVVLWVRSNSTIDQVFYARKGSRFWRINSRGGVLSAEITTPSSNDEWLWMSYPYAPGVHYDAQSLLDASPTTKWWGGSIAKGSYDAPYYKRETGTVRFLVVVVRYPLLAGLAAPWPFLWLFIVVKNRPRRNARRRVGNRCDKCSYNLTGNTSGTCPECGAPIAAG